MTFRSVYRTHMLLALPGCEEREYPLEIRYSGERGHAATSMDPGSDATVSIEAIHLRVEAGREPVPLPWLVDVLDADEDVRASLFEHWRDQDDDARDRRDEARAAMLQEEKLEEA